MTELLSGGEVRQRLALLNVDEVCELLQVKKAWLWEQCRAGSIPHIRMGREFRFRPADLETWLAEQVK